MKQGGGTRDGGLTGTKDEVERKIFIRLFGWVSASIQVSKLEFFKAKASTVYQAISLSFYNNKIVFKNSNSALHPSILSEYLVVQFFELEVESLQDFTENGIAAEGGGGSAAVAGRGRSFFLQWELRIDN